MLNQKTRFFALAAIVMALGLSSKAQAYGACHVGYTHVGPNGVQHYGHTAAYGPGGAASTSHYGATGGGYHYGATGASTYHYGAAGASTFHYGGYHYGTAGASTYHYGYHVGY
jgi:hypothetical protein